MRISDWSSDLCSSDLLTLTADTLRIAPAEIDAAVAACDAKTMAALELAAGRITDYHRRQEPEDLDYRDARSEEHTSELQSLMRISYAVFCLKKKKQLQTITIQSPCRAKVHKSDENKPA